MFIFRKSQNIYKKSVKLHLLKTKKDKQNAEVKEATPKTTKKNKNTMEALEAPIVTE